MIKQLKIRSKAQKDRTFDAYSESQQRLFDLNNQYYELSTPTEFAFDKINTLDHK